MKIKVKPLIKLVVFCSFLAYFGCSTDFEVVDNSTGTHFGVKNKGPKVKTFKGADAMQMKNKLEKMMGKSSSFNIFRNSGLTARGSENLEIDFSEIMEVIDTLGNKNYTFKIINHPDDNYKIFHNLVITEKDENLKIKLVKYEMTDEFALAYQNNSEKFVDFKGTVSTIGLDPAIDPCADLIIEVPGSQSGGSGYDGSGDNSGSNPGSGENGGPSGGSSGGGCVSFYLSCSCGRTYENWDSYTGSMCGDGSNPGYDLTIVIMEFACRMASDPCADEDGLVGILPVNLTQPCDELKKLAQSPNYIQSINYLKQKAAGPKEHAWVYKYFEESTNFAPPTVAGHNTKNPHKVELKDFMSQEWIGAMHNHTSGTQGGIKMFSSGDLLWLFRKTEIRNSYQPPSVSSQGISEMFLGLVNENEVYCLKIKDWTKFYTLHNPKVLKEFDEKLVNRYRKVGINVSQSQLQKEFLNLLNEFDLGVGLYKQETNGNWSEINLDPRNPNNIPVQTPCN
ncbi:hypothetical protein H9X57_11390 [Flavobacterium piscinae]|uniref:Uncharacterized protein n=1 Tax=Flavobacterium piscinae TaxID=2506424 RepID=A0A4Q1KVQ2_9FLAO|nr:hypothetical protein [Flavobacterium piscinae]MBC8883747.1 hypothetical protein [Flavobacterium piscinae]RXR33519.1 hypothetical protein EQG68_04630 [Flavobacterium piscinae]